MPQSNMFSPPEQDEHVYEINPPAAVWHTESSELFCPGKVAEERLRLFQESWRGGSTKTTAVPVTTHGQHLHRYDEDAFHYGRLLGKGSFSTAHRVYLRSDNRNVRGYDEESGQAYALKRLQSRVYENKTRLMTAASDLALETAILSNLDHENIITLHGIKGGDMIHALKDGSFFLILDLLVETLDERLTRWSSHRQPLLAKKRLAGVTMRIQDVALGIATGMEYLHSKHIIFRDLKPANIGFNEHGRIKIFDFGLSREVNEDTLTSSEQHTSQPRLMTGGAGTPRYMAPEVATMDSSYGFPADVYSFSILLWQIVTTQTPFANIVCPVQFASKVFKDNKRPSMKYVEIEELKTLLRAGWSVNPDQRPSFFNVRQDLINILGKKKESDKSWPTSCDTIQHLSNMPTKKNKNNSKQLDSLARPALADSPKPGFLSRVSSFRCTSATLPLPSKDNASASFASKRKTLAKSKLVGSLRRLLNQTGEHQEDNRGLSMVVPETKHKVLPALPIEMCA